MYRAILLMTVVLLASPLSIVHAQKAQDLLVLYTFQEGDGETVKDVSEFGDPLDLTVNTPEHMKWMPNGGVTLTDPALFASAGPATKIIEACKATNEITIQAWVTPANNTNTGPARIATLSANPSNRNFTLGQDTTGYQIRLRTTTTGVNGVNPALAAPNTVVPNQMVQLVYTFAAEEATFYIDGDEFGTLEVPGTFDTWDETYKFGIGHELDLADDLGRSFLGDYFLVAVYSRAIPPDELPGEEFLAVQGRDKLPIAWGRIKASR